MRILNKQDNFQGMHLKATPLASVAQWQSGSFVKRRLEVQVHSRGSKKEKYDNHAGRTFQNYFKSTM